MDRYRIQCRPVRDLIVDYLQERQPSLDFASLDAVSRTLAGLFWARIEAPAPGIDSLRLPPAVARAWKEDLKVKKRTVIGPGGRSIEISSPRLNAKDELIRVRAFYLDIAQWAAEEPARWGPWAVPCPIGDDEIHKAKDRKHRKARMDQRTRERLPVLPTLIDTADRRRRTAADLLQAAKNTEPGALIPGTEASLRRAVAPKAAGHLTWGATSPGQPGTRRHPQRHHQPPARPQRSDTAGGLLRRPREGLEPADAAAVPARHRLRTPRIHADRDPKTAHQRLAATGLTNADGEALTFSPHDLRRIFVTDAIMNVLPPHIAQVICGHKRIDTTMGYKAVYPAESIEAHRAFIARRRTSRPSEEYRNPTEEEWGAFLAHFEKRKVSIGTCARGFGTPCIHEHAPLTERTTLIVQFRAQVRLSPSTVCGRDGRSCARAGSVEVGRSSVGSAGGDRRPVRALPARRR